MTLPHAAMHALVFFMGIVMGIGIVGFCALIAQADVQSDRVAGPMEREGAVAERLRR